MSCLSGTLVYCGQTVECIVMPLGMEVGLDAGHVVLDGDQAPPPPTERGTAAPSRLSQFTDLRPYKPRPISIVAKRLDGPGPPRMPHGTEIGLGPGAIMLDGDSSPPKNKGHSSPQFLAHVYCGQTAGWIGMPLGTEVGDRRHYVRWGPPPRKMVLQPPLFGPCVLWPNGWMDQDTTWNGARPRPRRQC